MTRTMRVALIVQSIVFWVLVAAAQHHDNKLAPWTVILVSIAWAIPIAVIVYQANSENNQ